MNIGICTTDFTCMPMDTLLSKIENLGFTSMQLAFATIEECGFVPDGNCEIPDGLPEGMAARIKAAAATHNLKIHCVNGTFNMAHPDPVIRAQSLSRFQGFAEAVKAVDCKYISLCTGTRNADYLWAPHPDNGTDSAWQDMENSMAVIVDIARDLDLCLLIETEASNIVDSPKKALRLIESFGSDHLQIVMDCANLFHIGQAQPNKVHQVMDEAFDALKDHIRLAHGKDIRAGAGLDFCGAGLGIIDFPHMIRRLREIGYNSDMVLHGISDESDMPRALAYMENIIAEA